MNPVDIFKAYFDAFEATYLDDDWDRIAPYFNQIQQMDDIFDETTLANFGAWMEKHGALLA